MTTARERADALFETPCGHDDDLEMAMDEERTCLDCLRDAFAKALSDGRNAGRRFGLEEAADFLRDAASPRLATSEESKLLIIFERQLRARALADDPKLKCEKCPHPPHKAFFCGMFISLVECTCGHGERVTHKDGKAGGL